MKKQIRVTSISFEVPVLEYLEELATRDDRGRSYTVNQVIREHAKLYGQTLRSAREPSLSPGESSTCR
ncbi:MAG: hypothetical protein JNN07_27030 [Verrucomicrobiales bacterium]|nr:hypothetical protein [Verrucomicrobiales bacterium]